MHVHIWGQGSLPIKSPNIRTCSFSLFFYPILLAKWEESIYATTLKDLCHSEDFMKTVILR